MMSVLYFSWIESPRLSRNGMLPDLISNWTDKQENENLRTSIPFLFISVLIGIVLGEKRTINIWIMAFLGLVALVFLAEVGQLFLPLRRFDWADIAWGIIASFVGLLGMYLIIKLILNNLFN